MKICLISNLYPPISRGGAEKVVERAANGLRGAGHEVFVISTKPWSGWKSLKPEIKDESEIKIYRFYPLNLFYYLNDYKHNSLWRMKWHFFDMLNRHSRWVVKNILKREKPDVVMTHNLKGIGYLIPGAIRRLGIKHVHTLHDVQLSVPSGLIIKGQENNWQQKIFLRKWYEKICRWLFDSPDAVVSPSQWLLDFYTSKGFFKKSKKIILPNPIEQIDTSSSPVNGNLLKLLYLGQIEEHKGILFLVDVLEKIDIDFKLYIAGDGSKINELKEKVGNDDRFIIRGKLGKNEINQLFSEVDLTVVPSQCFENSPTVIYESLAAGVPVVAAKIGGVAELVKDGENGFTFEAGNAEDLVHILKYTATRRGELQKMRTSAPELSKEFSTEQYIHRLLENI